MNLHDIFYPWAVVAFAPSPHTGLYLAVRHPIRGLECPGGKVEPGESLAEACRRETLEESGAYVRPVRILHIGLLPAHPTTKGIPFLVAGILCEMASYPLAPAEFPVCAWSPADMPITHERVGDFYSRCVEAL